MRIRGRNLCHAIAPPVAAPAPARAAAFAAENRSDFRAWQANGRAAFRRALGPPPAKVPLRVARVERRVFKDYVREKIVFDVEQNLAAAAWVCAPRTHGQSRLPAILCCHGLGPGKDPLVGLFDGETCLEYHKLVAVRLAQRGFITLTPDRRGFGDCSAAPRGYPTVQHLQALDAYYRRTRRTPLLALDIRDGVRALDVLAKRGDVDATRIGCLGVMDGGAVAAGVAALDPRIGAASLVSLASDRPAVPGPSQMGPEWAWGSVGLCGLICPRPLQVQSPDADYFIPLARAKRAARQVQRFYALRGAPANFQHHVFDGVTEIDIPAAAEWMEAHLR